MLSGSVRVRGAARAAPARRHSAVSSVNADKVDGFDATLAGYGSAEHSRRLLATRALAPIVSSQHRRPDRRVRVRRPRSSVGVLERLVRPLHRDQSAAGPDHGRGVRRPQRGRGSPTTLPANGDRHGRVPGTARPARSVAARGRTYLRRTPTRDPPTVTVLYVHLQRARRIALRRRRVGRRRAVARPFDASGSSIASWSRSAGTFAPTSTPTRVAYVERRAAIVARPRCDLVRLKSRRALRSTELRLARLQPLSSAGFHARRRCRSSGFARGPSQVAAARPPRPCSPRGAATSTSTAAPAHDYAPAASRCSSSTSGAAKAADHRDVHRGAGPPVAAVGAVELPGTDPRPRRGHQPRTTVCSWPPIGR